MPKLPRVRTRVLTTIETRARLKAEAKFKISSLGLEKTFLDMVDRIDPLELMAVGATTFIVYDIIKSIPEFTAQATQLMMGSIVYASPFGTIMYDILVKIFGSQELTDTQKAEFQAIREKPDFLLFVKSFAIAYIIVKHSGQIIAGVGNMTGFIGSFLGLKVA